MYICIHLWLQIGKIKVKIRKKKAKTALFDPFSSECCDALFGATIVLNEMKTHSVSENSRILIYLQSNMLITQNNRKALGFER